MNGVLLHSADAATLRCRQKDRSSIHSEVSPLAVSLRASKAMKLYNDRDYLSTDLELTQERIPERERARIIALLDRGERQAACRAHAFDDGAQAAFDGGVLEYSTDDGTTWQDAGSLITDNGYNGTMEAGAGNPLGGREGFVGESNGYTSSRVDLTSLQGHSVRWRFRIGEDSISSRLPSWEIGPNFGWFVDDVRVYTCGGATNDTTPPFVQSHTPTAKRNVSPETDVTATFSEQMREGTISRGTVRLVREGSTIRVGASLSYDASVRKVILDPKRSLRVGATYRATVTTGVRDAAGNAMASDESWTFEIRR